MEIVAKDDLRNRISPRVYDFYKRNTKPDKGKQKVEGVVSWYKFHYQKDSVHRAYRSRDIFYLKFCKTQEDTPRFF